MRCLLALILSFILAGCSYSMSPREMINDCKAEIDPISFVKVAGDQKLKDDCYDKFRSCLVACYLDIECSKAHEEAICACESFKESLGS